VTKALRTDGSAKHDPGPRLRREMEPAEQRPASRFRTRRPSNSIAHSLDFRCGCHCLVSLREALSALASSHGKLRGSHVHPNYGSEESDFSVPMARQHRVMAKRRDRTLQGQVSGSSP